MSRRNITDDEIALIKAMLARNMKNRDIQFFFNRPDRPVNSGRITGIRNGSYGLSKNIARASDQDLEDFISAHSGPTESVAAVPVPTAREAATADPLADRKVRMLFSRGNDRVWRLIVGETDLHECKTNFGLKHPSSWLRAVAALANNAGGYIFFGVQDKGVVGNGGEDLSHMVVGMSSDEFAKMDPAEVTKRVKSVFDPTPRVRTKLISIGGRPVGVIHVERHESRPVIATKNEGSDVREGEIYFRYSGQSARIKYSDLRALLDARDRDARAQVLPMVERLLQLGPDRTMIADLGEGTLGDGRRAIQIDEALIESLNFIKEGEFSETTGAPTLRLVGDVQSVAGPMAVKTRLGLVSREDLLNAFLDQLTPDDPRLFIQFAVEHGQLEWFPLHYFAKLAGMSRAQLVDFINASSATPFRKAKYTKRVQPNAAFKPVGGKPKAVLEEILTGKPIAVVTPQEASHVAQAIEALPDNAQIDIKSVLWLLKQCLAELRGKTTLSFARRAICRVDELLFSETPSSHSEIPPG